jgi:amino acid adenylation domain-containing protein
MPATLLRSLPEGHPNGTFTPCDWQAAGRTIPDCFAGIADRFPGRLATCDFARRLTYGELDRAANRVANALLAASGTEPEAVIILAGVNTTATIAALGVFKANKFYVGLAPSFPLARARQIIADTGASVILAQTEQLALARELGAPEHRIIALDALTAGDESRPNLRIDPDAIALLNYTSGSTGQPKGVVQTHRSALAHAARYANAYRLSDADRLLESGSLAWAGTFWDLFGPLCLGASVASFDVTRHGMHPLTRWIRETGITVMSGMTMIIRLARDYPDERYPDVRLLQLGGDTVYRIDVEACQRVCCNAVVAVGLGMSEAGRVAEMFIPPGTTLDHDVAPVGYDVPCVRLLLRAEDGTEALPSEPGEIVVHSTLLAQGYWQRPELTAEKFQTDPLGGAERAYCTGDIGCRGPDGVLRHLGRKDFQVKIRGYPVPTNVVESRLLESAGIREACVVAARLPDGNQELVAYVAIEPDRRVSAESLRGLLGARLPEHMIPHRFVFLDRLPHTLTGKVDRLALPGRDAERPALEADFAAPRTPLETALTAIWREVLAIDAIGIDDRFLDLGGDSLRGTQILARVIDQFGVALEYRALLQAPTIADMAMAITLQQAGQLDAGELERMLSELESTPSTGC